MIMTKVKLIKKKRKEKNNKFVVKTITIIEIIEMVSFELSKELKMIFRLEKVPVTSRKPKFTQKHLSPCQIHDHSKEKVTKLYR